MPRPAVYQALRDQSGEVGHAQDVTARFRVAVLGRAAEAEKRLALAGDGGLMMHAGELATLAEQKANVTLVVMNDGGYGVIRNIQDADYGGRRCYADLHTPDFARLAQSLGIAYARVGAIDESLAKLQAAVAAEGPVLVEVDMRAIGPYAASFAGPPVRKS